MRCCRTACRGRTAQRTGWVARWGATSGLGACRRTAGVSRRRPGRGALQRPTRTPCPGAGRTGTGRAAESRPRPRPRRLRRWRRAPCRRRAAGRRRRAADRARARQSDRGGSSAGVAPPGRFSAAQGAGGARDLDESAPAYAARLYGGAPKPHGAAAGSRSNLTRGRGCLQRPRRRRPPPAPCCRGRFRPRPRR